MAKTKKELDGLKEELETLKAKLNELTEDELKEVTGGTVTNDENSYCEYLYAKTTFTRDRVIEKCWATQAQKATNEELGKCATCPWVLKQQNII